MTYYIVCNSQETAARLHTLLDEIVEQDDRRAQTACMSALTGPVTAESISTLGRARAGAERVLAIYAEIRSLVATVPGDVHSIAESAASALGLILMSGRISPIDFGEIRRLHDAHPDLCHLTYYRALSITLLKSYFRGASQVTGASQQVTDAYHVVDDIYGHDKRRPGAVDHNVQSACIAEVLRLLDSVVRDTTVEALRSGARAQCGRIRASMREAELTNATVVLTGKLSRCQVSRTTKKGIESTEIVKQRVGGVMLRQCATCAKLSECLACGACRLAYYCSKDCQKTARPVHKLYCSVQTPL